MRNSSDRSAEPAQNVGGITGHDGAAPFSAYGTVLVAGWDEAGDGLEGSAET